MCVYSACYVATAVCNVRVYRAIDYLHTDYSSAMPWRVYITAWAAWAPQKCDVIHSHPLETEGASPS